MQKYSNQPNPPVLELILGTVCNHRPHPYIANVTLAHAN
jgi:hypothetical protein